MRAEKGRLQEELLAMGFSATLSAKALDVTGGGDLQAAAVWAMSHAAEDTGAFPDNR